MTDRYYGFIVTLKEDIREDDAASLVTALSMVKGVASVRPNIGDGTLAMAEDRIKHRYQMALYDAVREVFEGKKVGSRPPISSSPPPKRRLIEPWQLFAILGICATVAVAVMVVGFHMRDNRVEALHQMEKACQTR